MPAQVREAGAVAVDSVRLGLETKANFTGDFGPYLKPVGFNADKCIMLWRSIILVAIALCLPRNGHAASCQMAKQTESSILVLQNAADNLEKAAQIDLAEMSPADFCKRNMIIRFINANPSSSNAEKFRCSSMSEAELERQATQIYARELDRARFNAGNRGWFSSLIQIPAAQHFSLLEEKDYLKDGVWLKPSKELVTGLYERAYLSKLDELEKNFRTQPEHFFKASDFAKLESEFETDSASIKESVAAIKICMDLAPFRIVQCTLGLKKIIKIARPGHLPASNNALAPVGVWKKVLSADKEYSEGLRLASLKIVGKLRGKSSQGSNVFDDLVSSFQESGFSRERSIDAAYDVLALYGNGGANVGDRAFDLKRWANYGGLAKNRARFVILWI